MAFIPPCSSDRTYEELKRYTHFMEMDDDYTCSDRTYEELKLRWISSNLTSGCQSSDRTYEELKPAQPGVHKQAVFGSDRTYEELKLTTVHVASPSFGGFRSYL